VKKSLILILGFLAFSSTNSYSAERSGDILDQEDYDPNTPYYQVVPTSWSAGFRAAFNQFPFQSSMGTVEELFFEKHLLFQKVGVLSAGVHAGLAPMEVSKYSNFKFGGLIRYQLQFIKNQIIVPTVAAVYDVFRLKAKDSTVQNYGNFGFMFGGMLNLGFFDRETARDGHQSIGLNRTYLTVDYRPLSLSGLVYERKNGDAAGPEGALWYFGIRMEFE
jgi:hypothetical protein